MSELEMKSLVRRIRLEYDEMPGLSLTIRQAARLWRLEKDVAQVVMTSLVDAEYLSLGRTGFIRRPSERR
jgi:hypothetical protein